MDFTKEYLERMGKKLSFLLRHDKDYQFDEHGYREVSDLIENQNFTFELLNKIVATNDKKDTNFQKIKQKLEQDKGIQSMWM